MRNENVDSILEICITLYNDFSIYGKEFEKLELDRPYIDIIKKGFHIMLDGEGSDIFEAVIETEILWFMITNENINKQMVLELNTYKKFWLILERKGRRALADFLVSAMSPELNIKYYDLLNTMNDELQESLENTTSEVTFNVTYLDKQK